jgi:recombinational DNA repair protein (RecF pathway)
MDLEERAGVDDNLERTCAVCGATLSEAEIEASREAGGRFLCSTHASEEDPVDAEPIAGDQPGELTG